jgi:hypothetical protein
LSLVKLPEGALMFPNPRAASEAFSLTKPCNLRNTTKEIVRRFAKLSFPDHAAAGFRCAGARRGGAGWPTTPTLLRNYTKRTKKADVSAASVIGAISKGVPRCVQGCQIVPCGLVPSR